MPATIPPAPAQMPKWIEFAKEAGTARGCPLACRAAPARWHQAPAFPRQWLWRWRARRPVGISRPRSLASGLGDAGPAGPSASQQTQAEMCPWSHWKVDEDRVHRGQAAGADVLRHTHHFVVELVVAHPHAFAERLFARPKFARRGFADDNRVLCRAAVVRVERAAAYYRDAEKLEVVRGDCGVDNLSAVLTA